MHEKSGVCFSDPILGIDPSSSRIGWACLAGTAYETGEISFPGELDQKLDLYGRWLRDQIRMCRPAIVVIEEPFIGQGSAATVLYQMQGVARAALAQYIGVVEWVANKRWKAQVLGNGGITTEDKMKGVIKKAVNGLGFETYGLDDADAVCIAMYMRKRLFDRIV